MSRLKNEEYYSKVPWPVVEQLVRLRLKPASRWQVYLTILLRSCRYRGREAWWSVAGIAEATGLSTRTVKIAIADLIATGHVRRVGRYRKLVVTIVTPSARKPFFIPAEV